MNSAMPVLDTKEESFVHYSVLVPPESYQCDEWFCSFTPRIHQNAELADAGSWQCQVDFLEASDKSHHLAEKIDLDKTYAVGCMNPNVGNFVALCGCESFPERLALITYMVEYAFIHDDVVEYAENKDAADLQEANDELVEGFNPGENKKGSKYDAKRRALQAKMAVELLDFDKALAEESLRLWKDMADAFVEIRDIDFKTLDEYFAIRCRDAGCRWTLSLLLFAMGWSMTPEEKKDTAHETMVAYGPMILCNDYFSWDREWANYADNGCKGEITNAVFLFMKWYGVDRIEAKRMIKREIMAREALWVKVRDEYLAKKNPTTNIKRWFKLLDDTIAGNFAWSMTTARYVPDAKDCYPGLRAEYQKNKPTSFLPDYNNPITLGLSHGDSLPDSSSSSECHEATASTLPSSGTSATSASPTMSQKKMGESTEEDIRDHTPKLSLTSYEDLVLEPSKYIEALPSKGVRNSAIDGLEAWYQVPDKSLIIIRNIINTLHNSSLMVDDVEDESVLRRGFPSTHTVFGVAQTINSSNMLLMKSVKWASMLSPKAVSIVVDRLLECHIGQGMDLYWTYQTHVPDVEEYFTMVDGKTGGLFKLLGELMRSEATQNKDLDLNDFMNLLGRFFQARDDYQNLCSEKYTKQKGFAEDIAEGKLSLPIIHALQSKGHRIKLLSIMQQRKRMTELSPEIREFAVKEIEAAGGLKYTQQIVRGLQVSLEKALARIEKSTGTKNWILNLAIKKLAV